jgi:hypothetical protein
LPPTSTFFYDATDFFVEIFFKTKRIVFHGWLEKVMGTIKEMYVFPDSNFCLE